MTRKLKIKMSYYGYEFNLEKDVNFTKDIWNVIEGLGGGLCYIYVNIGPRDSAKDDSIEFTYCPSSYCMAMRSTEIEQAGKGFAETVGQILKKLEEIVEAES